MNENVCENCQIGRYRPARLPFIAWFERDLMVLPNAPGHLCDMCGDSFFDPDFLLQLDTLINGEAESDGHRPAPSGRHRRSWQQT